MNKEKEISEFYGKLPVHEAPTTAWNNIAAQLDVVDMRYGLPVHTADKNLWGAIETGLEKGKQKYRIRRIALSVAASVIVLLTLTIILQNQNNNVIILSEEIVFQHAFEETAGTTESQRISRSCEEYPIVCESDEFNALQKQIERLKNQRNDLQKFSNYDADPQIRQYIEQINNDISKLETKILAMF